MTRKGFHNFAMTNDNVDNEHRSHSYFYVPGIQVCEASGGLIILYDLICLSSCEFDVILVREASLPWRTWCRCSTGDKAPHGDSRNARLVP